MKRTWAVAAVLCSTSFVRGGTQAAETESSEAGKKIEKTACVACHSLRLVESQRLSVAAWTKEIDKMVGWGAVVPERQTLINYLAQEYGDTRPVPPPERSGSR